MSDYLCLSCNEDGMVCIPRAQHEALMEMVKALPIIEGGLRGLYISRFDCANMIRDNLAALRAAGIPGGE